AREKVRPADTPVPRSDPVERTRWKAVSLLSGTQVTIRDDWQAIYGVKTGKYLYCAGWLLVTRRDNGVHVSLNTLPGEGECTPTRALHSRKHFAAAFGARHSGRTFSFFREPVALSSLVICESDMPRWLPRDVSV